MAGSVVACLRNRSGRKGSLAFGVLAIAAVVLELGAATLFVTNNGMLRARNEERRTMGLQLAEAGVQAETNSIWTQFKTSQSFTTIDATLAGASVQSPKANISNQLASRQQFSVWVVGCVQPTNDSYSRDITILSIGWVDSNNNASLDKGEVSRTVTCVMRFSLSRSGVFDYAYFVNNYGWMNGFGASDLIVNGDMRANGNFDFSGGTPTINGSVYAAPNKNLIPGADGIVNITPTQWTDPFYNSQGVSRARQAYDPTIHGAKGSTSYSQWQDIIYDSVGSVVGSDITGAVVGDATGVHTYSGTLLNPQPTTTLTMPDLSHMSTYTALSNSYVDTKQTYADGSVNPNYNQGAYVQVWNPASGSSGAYQTISTNGVVTGSAVLIGTAAHPIILHGPVTATQDVLIKGTVKGQGTVYSGRNIHIVGSINYADPPSFTGSNPTTIDNNNEKKSILGLAACASIIMGDTSQFGSYPLNYMQPPFTKARYDDSGNLIPAYNAIQTDSYGVMRYQSVLGDNYIHSVAENISQIDAVLYTNFVGGGNLGTGGGGVTFNGSIISRDEAMVLWSLPFRMNYDTRIKERNMSHQPLIDISLPRSPSVTKLTWQEN